MPYQPAAQQSTAHPEAASCTVRECTKAGPGNGCLYAGTCRAPLVNELAWHISCGLYLMHGQLSFSSHVPQGAKETAL